MTLTLKEALHALADGKKIRSHDWTTYYLKLEGSSVVDEGKQYAKEKQVQFIRLIESSEELFDE